MPLTLAPLNKELKVVRIIAEEKVKRHLENLGIMVGGSITSLSGNWGDVILKIHGAKFALNRELAMNIYVN